MKNDLETYCPQMADPIILFTFQPGLALSIFKRIIEPRRCLGNKVIFPKLLMA